MWSKNGQSNNLNNLSVCLRFYRQTGQVLRRLWSSSASLAADRTNVSYDPSRCWPAGWLSKNRLGQSLCGGDTRDIASQRERVDNSLPQTLCINWNSYPVEVTLLSFNLYPATFSRTRLWPLHAEAKRLAAAGASRLTWHFLHTFPLCVLRVM